MPFLVINFKLNGSMNSESRAHYFVLLGVLPVALCVVGHTEIYI